MECLSRHARRREDDTAQGRISTVMLSAIILMFSCIVGLSGPVFAQQQVPDGGYTPDTAADEVVDAATLKLFVKEAVKVVKSSFADSRNTRFDELSLYFRMEDGPWRSGSLYIFIMYDDGEVVFNASSPILEKTTLDITDRNGCNVGDEIVRVIEGEDRKCKDLGLLPEDSDGFLEYLWDDPENPDDNDIRFHVDGDKTISPGFSPKLSYVEGLKVGGRKIIAGSGIYPAPSHKADGGCAVSRGPHGHAPRGAAFSLLLAALVLLAAASRGTRKRTAGQPQAARTATDAG